MNDERLLKWIDEGETLMNSLKSTYPWFYLGFAFGTWWAERPWKKK